MRSHDESTSSSSLLAAALTECHVWLFDSLASSAVYLKKVVMEISCLYNEMISEMNSERFLGCSGCLITYRTGFYLQTTVLWDAKNIFILGNLGRNEQCVKKHICFAIIHRTSSFI